MYLFFIVVLWRVLLFAVSIFTLQLFRFTPQFPYSDIYLIPSGLPDWLWTWANFDGVHYLGIAQKGYFAQFTQAFFPLYPIVLGLTGRLFNDHFFIISGIFLSFIFFSVAVCLFVKLLEFDYPQKQVKKIIVFLLIFPTSYYFAAVYSESLFFLLTISAFLFARQKKWWFAAIMGALAAATRVSGILLVPALLYEWISTQPFKLNKLTVAKRISIYSEIKKISGSIFWVIYVSIQSPILFVIPFGLFLYMGYLQYAFKDALYFFHSQPAFGAARSTELISPFQVLYRYFKIMASVGIATHAFLVSVTELISFLFSILVLLIADKQKVRFSYLLFGWGMVLLPVVTGTFSSLPRYILLVFPLYIVLSTLKWEFRLVAYGLLVILGIFFTSQFIHGVWVA